MALVLQPQEPTTSRRGGAPSEETLQVQQVLRSNKGQWYLIYEGLSAPAAGQRVNQMRHSRNAWKGGKWDAKSGKQDDGTYKVWAKYVGRIENQDTAPRTLSSVVGIG